MDDSLHLMKGAVLGELVPGDHVPELQADVQWHPGHGFQHGHSGHF